jgi:putative heme-binding domain-containing protein
VNRTFLLSAASIAVLAFFLAVPWADSAPPEQKQTKAGKRVPWTTSRITGSPEPPPPYRTERVFPKLKFNLPVLMARVPGSGRLVVGELRGAIWSFPNDQDCARPDLFLDLGKLPGHWRTYGLAFHPNFIRNHFVYVCHVQKAGNPRGSRVSRFTVSATSPPRADPKSEKVLIEWFSGGHNGGCLQFGPDGYLYVSTGDGSNPNPPDALNTGQDIGDLLSSVLRIDVDRPEGGRPYGIPRDNPFVNTPGARPEVWAYGFRNPWKMAFDPKTGALWVGDVGWEMWEMVYRVERGGNYGWSVVEGQQSVRPMAKRGPTPILPAVIEHSHTESRSLTGGRVYHGKRLKDLAGAYLYGDYVTGKLWGLRHDGKKLTWKQELADSPLEIIDFGEDAEGEVYVLDHGGTINRLVPNPAARANEHFPRRLSETGLFASVKDHTPAPGVIPYTINAEPWADHAVAERLLAVPGLGRLGVYEKQNLQIGHVKGEWIFPPDTVLTRTVSLALDRGNPATRRRLETQVLHRDGDTWRAYNYLWNDEQTDAVLSGPEGSDRVLTIRDQNQPGGRVKQTWHLAGRTECLVCHTTRAGSVLGFNLAQMNRPCDGTDQLRALEHLGLFEQPLPDPLPRLPSPFDPKENLETRARAYLHANCAHCHRRGGGGTAPFELLYNLSLKKTFLVGSRPSQGTFNIHGAETVAPGDPYRSVLYYRMAKLGPGRMPHAGSTVVDEKGLGLIHEWIRRLPHPEDGKPERSSVSAEQRAALGRLGSTTTTVGRAKAIRHLLSSTSGALYLLRAVDTGRLPVSARRQVVADARDHPAAEIRELFERFLPESERVKRLGAVIRPAAILALSGDVARGRQYFFKGSGAQCRNCHRVGTEGQEVGPDLTVIGKKNDRTALLESILEPSKRIDPAYVTYLLETTRGAVHSGLLVRRTAKEVVLKGAEGKLITIPAREVESLSPQQKSLMPELLLRDMTAQQTADLLAFLASLK